MKFLVMIEEEVHINYQIIEIEIIQCLNISIHKLRTTQSETLIYKPITIFINLYKMYLYLFKLILQRNSESKGDSSEKENRPQNQAMYEHVESIVKNIMGKGKFPAATLFSRFQKGLERMHPNESLQVSIQLLIHSRTPHKSIGVNTEASQYDTRVLFR